MTIGMQRKNIVWVFLKQGLLIGIVGTILGNIIALALCCWNFVIGSFRSHREFIL